MASRWDITRAVRLSDLPPPSRLIMLVLADVAEVGTGEIPERFTPSLNVLARETGLDKSTVVRHLDTLDAAGWVIRTKPSKEDARRNAERTKYRLTVPSGRTEQQGHVAENDTLVAQNNKPRRRKRQDLVAQNNKPSCTVRQKETDLFRSTDLVRSVAPATPSPTPADLRPTQRSKAITDAYAAAQPMCKWPAVNAIVLKAIKIGRWSDDEIHAALLRLAEDGRSVTVDTLRIELTGPPITRLPARPSTTDQRVAQAIEAGRQVQAMLEGKTA